MKIGAALFWGGLCCPSGADHTQNLHHTPVPQPHTFNLLVLATWGSRDTLAKPVSVWKLDPGHPRLVSHRDGITTGLGEKPPGIHSKGTRFAFLRWCFYFWHSVALFIFFLGLLKNIGNSVSCLRNKGVCMPGKCAPKMKQIGTCGMPQVKCCKRK